MDGNCEMEGHSAVLSSLRRIDMNPVGWTRLMNTPQIIEVPVEVKVEVPVEVKVEVPVEVKVEVPVEIKVEASQ